MRKYALAAVAAFASAIIAMPASANEIRVEARGSALFAGGETEAGVGVAAGYDADLGPSAFVGAEISADKALIEDADIFVGLSGRGGVRISPAGALFAAGGYTFFEGEDAWHLGGGYEHRLGGNLYLKAEYRHFFADGGDGDQIMAGVGMKF